MDVRVKKWLIIFGTAIGVIAVIVLMVVGASIMLFGKTKKLEAKNAKQDTAIAVLQNDVYTHTLMLDQHSEDIKNLNGKVKKLKTRMDNQDTLNGKMIIAIGNTVTLVLKKDSITKTAPAPKSKVKRSGKKRGNLEELDEIEQKLNDALGGI